MQDRTLQGTSHRILTAPPTHLPSGSYVFTPKVADGLNGQLKVACQALATLDDFCARFWYQLE
jgi:hypothetical protein